MTKQFEAIYEITCTVAVKISAETEQDAKEIAEFLTERDVRDAIENPFETVDCEVGRFRGWDYVTPGNTISPIEKMTYRELIEVELDEEDWM